MSSQPACTCGSVTCPECGPGLHLDISPRAWTSLKLGLLSLVLTVLTGPLAVLWGMLSLRDIYRSPHLLRGKSMALAGIATGLIGTLLGGWLLLLAAAAVQEASDRTT